MLSDPRRPLRRAVLVMLSLTAVTVLAACGGSNTNTQGGLGGKTLTVAHDVSFPPFESKQDGEYVGFDLDLIHAVAKAANFTPDLSAVDFDGIIPALQANQFDLAVAAMTIKDERKQVIDFSIPYFKTGISIAVAPDTNTITTPEDLKGKTVAVKAGASGESFIRDLPYAKDLDIKTFGSNGDTYLAVQRGTVDATVNDDSTLRYYIAGAGKGKLKTVGALLTNDSYGIGIPKGNQATVAAVNAGLLKITADGTYMKLYKKWFDSEPVALPGQI